ncbi:segregation and condensation protein A [Liquorilactobacillus oeni]|uniref:Segregation and condensation protein A n=1 Tax=Liquorilactobacillus oeni DSM 19972 TaxID=1423777 RepID=A0A0R1M859_9LACO|nr:segregation/condensation protein A [Liquorilactobacillus oeni]KRL04335.1 segregation and condensation protein A [Liquorilactobacillus oeni DSM 19972]
MVNENFTESGTRKLTFKLNTFEGPLDLLLQLIKKNEMDLYNIQMTEITSQYIEQLHQMQTMSLDIAGEYLVMAATLLNIKSKMLLPKHPETLESDETEDPRLELVQQLLVHQCYQLASNNLQEMADVRALSYTREQEMAPSSVRTQLLGKRQEPEKLQQAFFSVLSRQRGKIKISKTVTRESFTIEEEMKRLQHILENNQKEIEFVQLFSPEKIILEQVVTTFLALLELVKRGTVIVRQTTILGPIKLRSGKKNADKPSKN